MHTIDEGVDDLSAYVNIHQNQIEKLSDVEHNVFTHLVFSSTGSVGRE